MARKKTKDWEMSTFSLDKDVKPALKEIAEFEGMSASEMIGFLVRNWDAGINPANKLSMLMADRKKLKLQLDDLDKKVELVTQHITLFENWKKQKSKKKGQAIEILKNKILRDADGDVLRIARTWQRITGVEAIELIAEANDQIRRSGI